MFKETGREKPSKVIAASISVVQEESSAMKEDGRLNPADQTEIADAKGKKFKCERCKAVLLFETKEFAEEPRCVDCGGSMREVI